MLKLKLLLKVLGALRRCVLCLQSLYGNTQFLTAPHVHRSSFWQSIVDNNLSEGVRRWLELLDRSASYRDRAIPMADMSTGDGATHERLNVILA